MKWYRSLLFPFSVLYDGITTARNLAFEYGVLKQTSFTIPIIAVGNLSTGGTGKTPMVEYLIGQHKNINIAVLSRGYGRKTKGYRLVTAADDVLSVGDEPLQIKRKFKDTIIVAVCEDRVHGINELIKNHNVELIILDDAMQHRYVKASTYVLLTNYDAMYSKDYLLPAGNLRESRRGANRAQHIVVTKCPESLPETLKSQIIASLRPTQDQQIYFTSIIYESIAMGKNGTIDLNDLKGKNVTVVTGIAKPAPFVEFVKTYAALTHIAYKDHHNFNIADINEISSKDIVITTEKDYVRLEPYNLPNVFYIPMKIRFIGASLRV